MPFWNFGDLRILLDTETDHDSPGSEELVSQIRENIEALFMLLLGTGTSGTATSDPSNSTAGYFYDTSGGYADDEHNGRTLVITSGAAKGNTYTIDDTVASVHRLACTGDNLYADGVRSGDSYIILYDTKVNADGHDHDGINSCAPVLANNSIANIKLHTDGGIASGYSTANVHIDIAMNEYSFAPNFYGEDIGSWTMRPSSVNSADYVPRFGLVSTGHGNAYSVRWLYVTGTDEPFVYAIRDKSTGEILHVLAQGDPPRGYTGCGETPKNWTPPIVFRNKDGTPWLDPEKHEEIVCWKVEKDVFKELQNVIGSSGNHGCKKVAERFDFVSGKAIRKANIGPSSPQSPGKK